MVRSSRAHGAHVCDCCLFFGEALLAMQVGGVGRSNILRSGGAFSRVLPGSAQKGAGPSSAWVSGLVAADSCDMFSGLSWAGTRGRESGAWF